MITANGDDNQVQKRMISNLCSSQEEADTRIILHMLNIIKKESDKEIPIIIRSPDTDVLILLIHFCTEINHKIYFDTGFGNKRRLISINNILDKLGKEFSKCLVGFHAFTGCDTTSSFIRKGKVRPFKLLQSTSSFWHAFQNLGDSQIVTNSLIASLQSFVCAMYGKKTLNHVDEVRHDLAMLRFKASTGVVSGFEGTDLCFLPPCLASLILHIKRSNYQCYIWKKANEAFPELPSPLENGWKNADGQLAILWNAGDVVPPEICNITNQDSDSDQLLDEEDYMDSDDDFTDELLIDAPFSDTDDDENYLP